MGATKTPPPIADPLSAEEVQRRIDAGMAELERQYPGLTMEEIADAKEAAAQAEAEAYFKANPEDADI